MKLMLTRFFETLDFISEERHLLLFDLKLHITEVADGRIKALV